MDIETQKIQIVLATQNVHKIREYRSLLKSLSRFDVLSLKDFPSYKPPEEVRDTFEGNACDKAVHAAKELGLWVLADDSGLVVPALDGKPGVFSARFAGKDATDKDNRKKLLSEMHHLKDQDRFAYFECCLALASPAGLKKCVCASCEGSVLKKERGGGGFGYDSLFVKHDYSKTFAELEESVKNRISHRGKAMDRMMLSLELLQ